MKLKIGIISLVILSLFTFIGVFFYRQKNINEDKRSLKIGILLYKADDSFISNLGRKIETYAKEFEKENDFKINIEIVDSSFDQSVQDRQVEKFISLGYDVLCVNPVERTNVSNIIDKCIQNDIELVFFNRKPAKDDLFRSNNIYYVGTDPKEEAVKQGLVLKDLYERNKKFLDLNEDGIIKYVLLEGEANHQDSLIRTKWSLETLQENNVPISKLAGAIANWEKTQASALMEEWLKKYKNEIELVISNNDDMALGAIEAIERFGDTRGIKVVGIDGLDLAIEAVKNEKMYATVANDIDNYAKTILDLAIYKSLNKDFPKYIKNNLIENKYYNVSQKSIIK